MAGYQLKTFSDLITAVREELGIQSSDTTAIIRIKRDINICYSELQSENRWWWTQGDATIPLQAYISTGTAAVVAGNSVVTLTVAPGGSKRGQSFAVDGYSEIYTIESNDGVTVKLNTPYTGASNPTASYKIWSDKVALPVDCNETVEVFHDHHGKPLENVGRQEFYKLKAQSPRAEGKPVYYYTGDYIDPLYTSTIAGMPALISRASSGVVKTLIFASTIPSTVVAGSRLRVSEANKAGYNGEIVVTSLSTTTTSNDTLTYIGVIDEEEAAIADTDLTVEKIDSEENVSRYRELHVWPALTPTRLTLHVNYMKQVSELENDNDEPSIPLQYRSALLYAALHRAWSRARNPEEAQRNFVLYQSKLTKMQGKLQDTLDTPKLVPSKRYLGGKRVGRSGTRMGGISPDNLGGGASGALVSGTPNTVATFNGSGEITGSSVISVSELEFLDGVTSDIQPQINALGTRVTTAEADITALEAADVTLQANINSEAAARAAAITAEATTRATADTTLQTNITAEAGARVSADTTLQANIDAEATARASADTTLQNDINTRALASDLTNHLSDATDAHDASAISSVASGNLAATDVQAALNELQTDIDTRATSAALTAHISDTTDAHAASAITNTPSGSLVATTVQAALDELQTDVNGREPYLGTPSTNGYVLSSTTGGTRSWVASSGYSVPRSMVKVADANGAGSTSTKKRRFSTTVTNTGTAITYADSATGGASFTINEAGVYAISYSDSNSGANYIGIGLNSTNLDPQSLADANNLAVTWIANNDCAGHVSWTGILAASDVIYAHVGATTNPTQNVTHFTITQVSR